MSRLPALQESPSIRSTSTAMGAPPSIKTGFTTTLPTEGSSVSLKEPDERETTANPFKLPTNEDIFRLREEERQRKQMERTQQAEALVADKTTFASRMQATITAEGIRSLYQVNSNKSSAGGTSATPPPGESHMSLAHQTCPPTRRKEHENMKEFINKKREIFLVQMTLDTKRAEIKKLEERAKQREEALKKSEQMLEEDALKFDAFLKENDEKVQEAIKKAEVEAKAKQDKVHELKRLNTMIATLKSELNKYEEQLEDCRKYKEFLDSITPSEWFSHQAATLQKLRDARVKEWQAQCEAVRKRKEMAQQSKLKAENDYANARTQQEAERAERAIAEATATLKEALAEKEPPVPDLEKEVVLPEEADMFFKRPDQLLEVFAQLEENNLFLIQIAQETEESLEAVKTEYLETTTRLGAQVVALDLQLNQLQMALDDARDKSHRLRARTMEGLGSLRLGGVSEGDVGLDVLRQQVAQVYVKCGFDADASITTVQMLANIESKMEEYLTLAATMPKEYVEAAEKAREKERRQVVREERMAHQKREHEERVRRALERAAAPAFKKTGKPVMFRSQPLVRKVVKKEDTNKDEEAELEAFLAKELL